MCIGISGLILVINFDTYLELFKNDNLFIYVCFNNYFM